MNNIQQLGSTSQSSTSGEDRLRALVDDLANQMCQAVDGCFDFNVTLKGRDETLEKLQMLINFLIDSARRALAEAKKRECDLDMKTEALADSNRKLHREIDDRRQVQQTLRENEDYIRAIMDAAADAILTINDQGILETINQSGERMFGYSADELIGKNISKLAVKPHDSLHDSYIQAYWETGKAKIIDIERETEGVHKDGTTFPIALRVSEMRYNGQRKFVGSVQDISERRRAEKEREKLHQKFLEVSRNAGMAEVATGVLHNVGNVLNSVNVSASLVAEKVRASSIANVSRLSDMFSAHRDDLGDFLAQDEKGRLIPAYLEELGQHLIKEQDFILEELATLDSNLGHIKDVISTQQTYAKTSSLTEVISLQEVFDDAIRINSAALTRHDIQIVREFEELPPLSIDRHRLIQILVNLISNAKYAMSEVDHDKKIMTLRIAMDKQDPDSVALQVSDNGCGIQADNLTRIFTHGFTTRSEGHGFGLHSSSLSAGMLGGSLSAASDGPGKGAVFTLTLPSHDRKGGK